MPKKKEASVDTAMNNAIIDAEKLSAYCEKNKLSFIIGVAANKDDVERLHEKSMVTAGGNTKILLNILQSFFSDRIFLAKVMAKFFQYMEIDKLD